MSRMHEGSSPKTIVALVSFGALLAIPAKALAGPQQWYEEGMSVCVDRYLSPGTSFRCNICGVDAGCDGDACFWGSVKASAAGGLSEGLQRGFQMYCANQGGAVLPSESPAGMQMRAANSAFASAERGGVAAGRGGLPLTLGGLLNYASGDTQSAYGLAAPFATGYAFSRSSAFDLSGVVLAGSAPGFQQYGASLRPGFRTQSGSPASDATRMFFGVSAPALLVLNTGSGVETSAGFQAGGGLITGLSFAAGASRLGAGVAVDALYANAFRLPTQILLRYARPAGIGFPLVLQPGVSVDPVAGSFGNTLSVNALAGLDFGTWLFGAQAFIRSGTVGVSLGVTRQGDLGLAVAQGTVKGSAASVEQPPKEGERVVVKLHDGRQIEGTLLRLQEGKGCRVKLEDGSESGHAWSEIADVRRVDPSRPSGPDSPESLPTDKTSPGGFAKLDEAWRGRTGARFSLAVGAVGFLTPRWVQMMRLDRTEEYLKWGGGGGLSLTLGLAVLSAPEPSSSSTSIHGLRLGFGLNGGAIAADKSVLLADQVAAAAIVHVPLHLGFVIGDGHFEENNTRWRGVLWGLHYEPSYAWMGYDIASEKWDSMGMSRWSPPRGMINLLGVGTTLDVVSLDIKRGFEPNLRFQGSFAYPYGGRAMIATLGLGVVWY